MNRETEDVTKNVWLSQETGIKREFSYGETRSFFTVASDDVTT